MAMAVNKKQKHIKNPSIVMNQYMQRSIIMKSIGGHMQSTSNHLETTKTLIGKHTNIKTKSAKVQKAKPTKSQLSQKIIKKKLTLWTMIFG